MAYSEPLAERVRRFTAFEPHLLELSMFGGLAYTLHGNMALGVLNDELIVRVPRGQTEMYLSRGGARAFDFTGRTMQGFVAVDPEATSGDETLRDWVEIGLSTAGSMPPKPEKPARARASRR